MGWNKVKLAECVDLLSGGTPSKSQDAFWNGNIPWVSAKDMTSLRLYDTEDHVTNLGAISGTRLMPKGTLLAVVRGMSLAKEFRIVEIQRLMAFNQDVKAIIPRPNINSRFLLYSLLACRDYIIGIADEAAHGTKRLQTDRLLEVEIPLPHIDTQRRIALILSAYDDLIENNTRRIAILNEMARRIYEEWFVCFRFLGNDQVKMVESELGMIPEGWSVKRIVDFGQVITGKTPSKTDSENFGNDVPFIKTPDMHGNIFCISTGEMLSFKGANSQKGKMLPADSLCVSCIGTAGVVCITSKPAQTNQQINSVILHSDHHREFLYFALAGLKETINLYGANGATMVNLNKSKFEGLKVVSGDETTVKKFHDVAKTMFDQIKILQLKNINLRTTRDLLLPKLISGEFDISNIPKPESVAA